MVAPERYHEADLDWFFEGYVHQAAVPELVVEAEDGQLSLAWSGTGETVFTMPVPVVVDGELRRVEMPEGRARIPLPEGARYEVDPEGWVLKK